MPPLFEMVLLPWPQYLKFLSLTQCILSTIGPPLNFHGVSKSFIYPFFQSITILFHLYSLNHFDVHKCQGIPPSIGFSLSLFCQPRVAPVALFLPSHTAGYCCRKSQVHIGSTQYKFIILNLTWAPLGLFWTVVFHSVWLRMSQLSQSPKLTPTTIILRRLHLPLTGKMEVIQDYPPGNSLAIQCLGLHAFTAKGPEKKKRLPSHPHPHFHLRISPSLHLRFLSVSRNIPLLLLKAHASTMLFTSSSPLTTSLLSCILTFSLSLFLTLLLQACSSPHQPKNRKSFRLPWWRSG